MAVYETVHRRLIAARGPASNYLCVDCGQQAAEWSFMGEGHDAGVRAYSENLDEYEPRCMSCHDKFDGIKFPHDATVRGGRRTVEVHRENGFFGSERHREISRQAGAAAAKRYADDPEWGSAIARERAPKGKATIARRRAEDPEYDAAYREAMTRFQQAGTAGALAANDRIRPCPYGCGFEGTAGEVAGHCTAVHSTKKIQLWKCATAGCTTKPMNAGPLANHQKRSGHTGRTAVDTPDETC